MRTTPLTSNDHEENKTVPGTPQNWKSCLPRFLQLCFDRRATVTRSRAERDKPGSAQPPVLCPEPLR